MSDHDGTTTPPPTWGERWLTAMGRAGRRYADDLGRGSYYRSRGAVRRIEWGPGQVTATIQAGRRRAQTATIAVQPLDDDAFGQLVETLAGELRFSARLYEGDLPAELGPILADAGVDLVPTHEQVEGTCICTDDHEPCLHLATTHHALAQGLDEDPFRLLELRGRDRDTLLAAIRARRSGVDLRTAARSPDAVALDELGAIDPRRARGDLDAVQIHPHPVDDPAWLFDHLGTPPGVEDTEGLQQLVARAADTAWRIASGEGSEAADVEVLLAELRSQRMASASALAEAIGWDPEVARTALDELFESGQVLRMGSGEDARYRAAM